MRIKQMRLSIFYFFLLWVALDGSWFDRQVGLPPGTPDPDISGS